MTVSIGNLLRNAIWTVGSYGLGQALRFLTNVVLARLLAPELFGIMLIVNSLRAGIELMSDVGIGQNIVYHKEGNNPEFYNTAWTVQLIRGILLWLVSLAVAVPVAQFYQMPILVYVVPITAFSLVLGGLTSVSRLLLQKRMQIARLNAFETILAVISSVAYVVFAYLTPTVWSLVWGGVFGSVAAMIGSYFLIPDVRQSFYLSKRYTWEILHYGKWIFISSIVYFLSTNFDRLYLAKVVPLELLGVYGIARSISEMLGLVVLRLGNYVLFPLIASHSQMPRSELRAQLISIRAKFLFLAAFGLSLFAATADLPIKILYDQRYQAATWMLPMLIIGAWLSILAYINESILLGFGKPSYSAVANSSKFAFLLIGMPLSVKSYGMIGGILVVVLSDLWRYIPILVGQRRQSFSFGTQDLLATLAMFLLVILWEWIRWISGFGTSFEGMPINLGLPF